MSDGIEFPAGSASVNVDPESTVQMNVVQSTERHEFVSPSVQSPRNIDGKLLPSMVDDDAESEAEAEFKVEASKLSTNEGEVKSVDYMEKIINMVWALAFVLW